MPFPALSLPAAVPRGLPAAARAVLRLLQDLPCGVLQVHTPEGATLLLGHERPGEPRATIALRDWSVCAAALRSGDIGFAETYLAGGWSTPDLPSLLKLMLANRERAERVLHGSAWGRALHRIRHVLRRNTRRGSARNVQAHYDLGNRFYEAWLDGTMTYSAAWFDGDRGQPLEAAQAAKLRRALRQCGVQPGERLLEIGCGWGSLAECAAAEFGARVTGLTLSPAQWTAARQRLGVAGLDADLRLQDYRGLDDPPFDAAVSIEMFEAVGEAYWPAYFAALARSLKPGGRACVQTITIRDDLFERYRRSTDFIQRYIFPGGLLPSPGAFRAAARTAGFEIADEFAFGGDYAETLRRWRQRFLARERAIREQGFDARFMRLWDFYLAYCEAAFDDGSTDVVQFTLVRGR